MAVQEGEEEEEDGRGWRRATRSHLCRRSSVTIGVKKWEARSFRRERARAFSGEGGTKFIGDSTGDASADIFSLQWREEVRG